MKTYKISYYDIPHGAHLFAFPEFTRSELVKAESKEKLDEYITSKSDLHGTPFEVNDDFNKKSITREFNYISKLGGVKVVEYKEPKIKQL